MKHVRIGCSGWNYDSWTGRLYPEGAARRRWLCLYAERFDTVEVNSTFYRLASRRAVESWVAATPPSFMFAVKASRYLTHIRRLTDLDRGFKRFYEPLEPMIAAGRLGPVLWQLPENFHHGARGRRGKNSASELDEWARRIAQWRRRQAYFNNDREGFAPANALGLRRRLAVA
jgi:uncharacterized protein YecE (DUF72 family)